MNVGSKSGRQAADRAASRRLHQWLKGGCKDRRPEARRLLQNIQQAMPRLRKLLRESSHPWVCEDGVYRFYSQSFKVFHLQAATLKIVERLTSLAPQKTTSTDLNPWFLGIVKEGTGKTFKMSDNKRWQKRTRPILEAFFHARYFLEMIVKYGKELQAPPGIMPSGWGAVLHLYNLG